MRQHHQVLQAVQGLCVNSFLNSFSSCRWGQIFLLPDGALLHFKTTKSLQQDNWFHPGCFIHFFMSCNHGQANHCRPVIQGFLCVDCFYLLIYYKYTYLDEIQVINWVYCATPIVHANDRSPNFTNNCKESTLQSNWPDVRESKSCVTQKTSSAIVSGVHVDGRILICKVLKWAWLFRIHCGFHQKDIPQRWILKIFCHQNQGSSLVRISTSHVSKMPDSQFCLVRFVKAAAAGSPCLFGDTWIRNFRVDEGGHADPRMGVNEVLIQDTASRIGVTFVKV